MKRVRSLLFSASVLSALLLAPKPSPADSAIGRAHHSIFDRKLSDVNFTNVALKDAVEFIHDVTAANIHVNWRAIETAGIAQDVNVNMHLRNVSLRKALSLLLSEAAGGTNTLAFYSDQGVIEITTKDIADHDMFTRVYPVEDLVMEIPDFTDAPDLSLLATQTSNNGGGTGTSGGINGGGSSFGGGGGNSIFGGNTTGKTEKTKTREERGQDLVALVRDVVYPDVWRENGGPASIRYFNGKLIVTAPRSVHEALGGYYD